MGRVGVLLLSCMLLLAGGPGWAGGAWPRGKGHVFGSLAWSNWSDLLGYLQELQEPYLETPELETTEEISGYFEYGLTERLTFGLDTHSRPNSNTGAAILFLKTSLGNLDWYNKYAIEFGVGQSRAVSGNSTITRVSFMYGRGFVLFDRPGWVNIDAKVGTLEDDGPLLYKIDSTFGYNSSDRNMWFLQMQSGMVEGNPAFTRALPTYVRSFGNGLSIETALIIGVDNDPAQGMKIGAWLDF